MSRSRGRRSSQTRPATEGSSSNKAISTYDRAFQQVLTDFNVYPPYYKPSGGRVAPKPVNLANIHKRLAQPRASLSPTRFPQEQHDSFVDLDANAGKEGQVKTNVIPIIAGTIKDARTASGEIPFTNLTPLIDNEHLAPGNPDFWRGAHPEDLERSARMDLLHTIVPSTQHDLPILPNHFLAAKGPDGTAAVAVRQATHDGFLGSRGMQDLRNYGRAEPQFDGQARVFSHIYSNGQLHMFTNHPVEPKTAGGRASYYMTHLRCFAMRDTLEVFVTGATYYRNSLDLAEEWRDEAISAANEVVAKRVRGSPVASNNAGARFALDSLAVESQVEPALSVSSEDFATTASGQE